MYKKKEKKYTLDIFTDYSYFAECLLVIVFFALE